MLTLSRRDLNPGTQHIIHCWAAHTLSRPILETSLVLDSHPGYLLTELLDTCLHIYIFFNFLSWIYSFQILYVSKEASSFVWPLCQQLLTQTINCSCYLHSLCLPHSLDFFQLWGWSFSLPPPLSLSSCQQIVSHHRPPLLVSFCWT